MELDETRHTKEDGENRQEVKLRNDLKNKHHKFQSRTLEFNNKH